MRAPGHGITAEELGRTVDLHGALQAVSVQLTGGVFLAGYALALGADSVLIGLLAALPLVAKLAQLYTSWRIERAGHWKRSAIEGAVLGRTALLLAALIPFTALPDGLSPWALVGVLTLSSLGAIVFETAFLTWMAELIPPQIRGAFWGRRGRVAGIAGLLASLAAALALDRWRESHPGDPRAFGALFAIGALAGLSGVAFLRRIPLPRRKVSRVVAPSLTEALSRPARDRNFRRLIVFAAAWGFSATLAAPFYTVYMLQQLRLSFTAVTAFGAITVVTMALTQAHWGRLADHFGNKPTLRAGTYLITLVPTLWLFTRPDRLWPVFVLQFVAGLGWGAYHVSLGNLVLKLAPEDARASYVAMVGAVTAAVESVGPVLGGLLLGIFKGLVSEDVLAFHLLFSISLLSYGIATGLPGRVHEPGGATLGRMIRVIARFRSMDTSAPFDMLFNYAYTHLARIADFIAREEAPAQDGGRDLWTARR